MDGHQAAYDPNMAQGGAGQRLAGNIGEFPQPPRPPPHLESHHDHNESGGVGGSSGPYPMKKPPRAQAAIARHRANNGQSKSGPYAFVCKECGMNYSRLEHLTRHERSHRDEKPFVCTVCNKAFGRRDILNRHMTIHSSGNEKGERKPRAARVPKKQQRQMLDQHGDGLHHAIGGGDPTNLTSIDGSQNMDESLPFVALGYGQPGSYPMPGPQFYDPNRHQVTPISMGLNSIPGLAPMGGAGPGLNAPHHSPGQDKATVPRPCTECLTSNVRCSGTYPCDNCTHRGVQCKFVGMEERRCV